MRLKRIIVWVGNRRWRITRRKSVGNGLVQHLFSNVVLILFVYESILRITNQVISLSHADLHIIILLLHLPRMHNSHYKSAGYTDSQDAAGAKIQF